MKEIKLFLSVFTLIFVLACSTSSDANSNSNTTVVPLAPTELEGTLINTQVALTWVDNSTNETGFKIDRKVGSGNWVVDYASVNADVINYTDTSVSQGMTYTYRACSYNAVGKSLNYSNLYTVTISFGITLPTLSTTAVTGITNSTATSGGTITNDGGASITARGVCWSTIANPTIALATKTNDGSGTGAFVSDITGLAANTTYYVRGYATNSVGTSYGTEVNFTTANLSNTSVTDIDGNTYQSVTICSQTWTQRNLNVSKYSDGSPIPQVTDPTAWSNLTTGAWCYYNNDPASEAVYGKLYNWYAAAGIYDAASLANPTMRKKLAPAGWHVPSDAEWTLLTTCLGGESLAGGKMKSTGTTLWYSPNTGATNESGFTGLPGGYRYGDDGTFNSVGVLGYWWSSAEGTTTDPWTRFLDYGGSNATRSYGPADYGFSVRCLRD